MAGARGAVTGGAVTAGANVFPRFAPSPSAINESEFSFPLGSRFWSC